MPDENKYLTAAKALRALAKQTGDKGLLEQADALESQGMPAAQTKNYTMTMGQPVVYGESPSGIKTEPMPKYKAEVGQGAIVPKTEPYPLAGAQGVKTEPLRPKSQLPFDSSNTLSPSAVTHGNSEDARQLLFKLDQVIKRARANEDEQTAKEAEMWFDNIIEGLHQLKQKSTGGSSTGG